MNIKYCCRPCSFATLCAYLTALKGHLQCRDRTISTILTDRHFPKPLMYKGLDRHSYFSDSQKNVLLCQIRHVQPFDLCCLDILHSLTARITNLESIDSRHLSAFCTDSSTYLGVSDVSLSHILTQHDCCEDVENNIFTTFHAARHLPERQSMIVIVNITRAPEEEAYST